MLTLIMILKYIFDRLASLVGLFLFVAGVGGRSHTGEGEDAGWTGVVRAEESGQGWTPV